MWSLSLVLILPGAAELSPVSEGCRSSGASTRGWFGGVMDTGGLEQMLNVGLPRLTDGQALQPRRAKRPVQPVCGSAQLDDGEKIPGAADLNQIYSKAGKFWRCSFQQGDRKMDGSW